LREWLKNAQRYSFFEEQRNENESLNPLSTTGKP
jgi:hypothetical protein